MLAVNQHHDYSITVPELRWACLVGVAWLENSNPKTPTPHET